MAIFRRTYFAGIIRKPTGQFVAYLPDFEEIVQMGDSIFDVMVQDRLDELIAKTSPGMEPVASDLVNTIFKTKKYLRMHGESIETYVDNHHYDVYRETE